MRYLLFLHLVWHCLLATISHARLAGVVFMLVYEAWTWPDSGRFRVGHVSDTDTCPTRPRHVPDMVRPYPTRIGLCPLSEPGFTRSRHGPDMSLTWVGCVAGRVKKNLVALAYSLTLSHPLLELSLLSFVLYFFLSFSIPLSDPSRRRRRRR